MEGNPLKQSSSSSSLAGSGLAGTPTGSSGSHKPQVTQHHHSSHHHHHHINNPSGLHHSQLVVAVSNDSKFYVMSSIEIKDPLESQLEDSFNKLQSLINPPQSSHSDNSLFNSLTQYANQSKAHYDELCGALLYSILTDPSTSSRCLRNLFLCNNLSGYPSGVDSSMAITTAPTTGQYTVLISNLSNITSENYHRLKDQPRQQLVWLLKELVKARVNQCDKLLILMIRNIQSGNLSDKNVWLAESLLDILSEQINNLNDSGAAPSSSLWIYTFNNSELMLQAVYTFLRIIADHSNSNNLNQLRQRESEFCVQILREKWNECITIGRDLVRLLQNLSKIPEFETLWKDIILSPQTLSPQFAQNGGLLYLMKLPTKKRCLISRLTLDMERKIYFLITSVKNGQQKRYQDWFQRQYLNTPESQSLRVDLIRYILVVVHPSNEQLNAGLVPRWALCSWLLSTCTNLIDAANLKLALFFDWLLYDPKKDNIMLIEPGILLMFNSLRANMPLSNTTMLFDFLCRIAVNYHLPYREHFLVGIQQAFKDSVDKRVIPSIQVFFDPTPSPNPKMPLQQQPLVLDKELKSLIQNTFGNFFQTMVINTALTPTSQTPLASPSTSLQPPTKPPTPQSAGAMPLLGSGTNVVGSNSSLFKRTGSNSPNDDYLAKNEPMDITSPLHSFQTKLNEISYTLTDASMKQNQLLRSELKIEQVEDSNSQTFSSEDEETAENEAENEEELMRNQIDNENTNLSTKSGIVNNNNSQQTNGLIQFLFDLPVSSASTSPTPLVALEQKIKSFLKKPFKIFSTIDEQTVPLTFSQSNNQSSAILENHLSLLPSNELRTKLSELNDKLNGNVQSISPNQSNNGEIANMFKEIINLINANDDETSIPDIAACISIVLKNEFTNNLLKMNGSNLSNPKKSDSSNNLKVAGFKDVKSNQQSLPKSSNVKHLDFYKYDIFSLVNNKLFANYVNDLFINGANNNRFILFNCLFKELIKTKNQSPQREALIHLLNEIYMKQNRLGYFFLFYISALCLVNVKLNGEENLNKLARRKKLRQYSEITKQTISRAFRKNEELKKTLMIYNEFINEYLKTNNNGSNMNIAGSNPKVELTTTNPLSSKNQISTYDSDLSEEDEEDENSSDSNASSNDSKSNSEDSNDDDQSENDDSADSIDCSTSEEEDDDDDSSIDDDSDKESAAKNDHDDDYSDEDSNNDGNDDSDANQSNDSDDSNESNGSSSDNELDLNNEFDLNSLCSNELNYTNNENMGRFLMQDLRLCQQDDPYLFIYLLPFVTNRAFLKSQSLYSFLLNNSEFIYLIVSCIDSKQLKEIISEIMNKNLVLFRTTKIQKSSSSNKKPRKGVKKSDKSSNKSKKSSAKQKSSSKAKRKSANEKKKSLTSKSPTSKSSSSTNLDPTNKKRKRTTSRTKKLENNKKQRTLTSKAKIKDDKSKSKQKYGSKKAQSSNKSTKSKSQSNQKSKRGKFPDKKCQYQVDESFIKLLNLSLEWESIEQSFFWQLLSAHSSLTKLTNPLSINNDNNTSAAANKSTTSKSSSSNNRNTRANPISDSSDSSSKKSVGNESSLIRLNVNNINNKMFVNFFNNISSIRHNEAIVGITNIFKMNKPNIHMINALMKRPINDLNIIESLFTHWLDKEQEFLIETNFSVEYFNHKHNLAYLLTRIILKSAIVFDKFSIRLKRQVSSSIKASSTSNTLSKLEDELEDIDEYDLATLRQILNKLNRLYFIKAFRTKRFLRNYKLLLAIRSAFIKCFKSDYEQVSDDDEYDYDYNSDNDLINYRNDNDDDDDYFDENNDSDNEGINNDSVEYSQFNSSNNNNGNLIGGSSRSGHRRIVNLKLKKYLNLKRLVDLELIKYNDKEASSSSNSNSNNESKKNNKSINFANFKLDDESESFLVKNSSDDDEDNDSNKK